MNKIPKYVVIIVGILVMVVLLPLGYVRYKTRYEAEQISTSTSPDGDYELVIYSVGASESSSRCILSESDNSVEYIVYDGKSENEKCGLYVRYRAEKGGGRAYDYGSAEIKDIYAYVFSSGEVISSGKINWEDTGTDEFERATE